MKNKQLYKRFKLNPKTAKPGDLMKAASKRKAEGKGFPRMHKKHKAYSEADMGSMKGYNPNAKVGKGLQNLSTFGVQPMGSVKPSTMAMAKSHKKHKTHKKVERESNVGELSAKRMNAGGPNEKKLSEEADKFTKSHKKMHCKSCGKAHEKGKHMKSGKKHKEHSAGAIKGLKDFVAEESKEKGKKMKSREKKGKK